MHIEHLEDLIFTKPTLPFTMLQNLEVRVFSQIRNRSSVVGNISPIITTKLDGAPAIVIGKERGKIFVSTKSAFNKKPLRPTSPEEIINQFAHRPKEIVAALLTIFDAVSDSYDKLPGGWGAVQGDLLYLPNTHKLFGNTLSFHPNMLLYESPYWRKTTKGICIYWHTAYDNNFNVMYDPVMDVSWPMAKFSKISNPTAGCLINAVWKYKPNHPPLPYDVLDCIPTKGLQATLSKYINTCLWYEKWPKASQFMNHNAPNLIPLEREYVDKHLPAAMACWYYLYKQKMNLIKNLHSESRFKPHIVDQNGIKIPTNHEGFVWRDHLCCETVKLVDRMEFSRINQNGAYKRGWLK